MKEIPIEFIAGFWVTLPIGLIGRGSEFLLAENIRATFSIGCAISKGNWSNIEIAISELSKDGFSEAIIKIIADTWIETRSVCVVGEEEHIRFILSNFLVSYGGIPKENVGKVISSKI